MQEQNPPKLWCLQKNLFKTLITTEIMLSKLYFAPPTLKPSYGPEVCLALKVCIFSYTLSSRLN